MPPTFLPEITLAATPTDVAAPPIAPTTPTYVVEIHLHLMQRGDDYLLELHKRPHTTSPEQQLLTYLDQGLTGDASLFNTLYLSQPDILPPLAKRADDTPLALSLTPVTPSQLIDTFCFNAQNAYLRVLLSTPLPTQLPLTWDEHLRLLSQPTHHANLLSNLVTFHLPKFDDLPFPTIRDGRVDSRIFALTDH